MPTPKKRHRRSKPTTRRSNPASRVASPPRVAGYHQLDPFAVRLRMNDVKRFVERMLAEGGDTGPDV